MRGRSPTATSGFRLDLKSTIPNHLVSLRNNMPDPSDVRRLLHAAKVLTKGRSPQVQFMPNGCLGEILGYDLLVSVLAHPRSQIPWHKVESTANLILSDGKKIYSILVEAGLEAMLTAFIEWDLMDSSLPLSDKQLETLLEPFHARDLLKRQWEYLTYEIRRDTYQRVVPAQIILPFLEQKRIGGGGFSSVDEILVHPNSQSIQRGSVVC